MCSYTNFKYMVNLIIEICEVLINKQNKKIDTFFPFSSFSIFFKYSFQVMWVMVVYISFLIIYWDTFKK